MVLTGMLLLVGALIGGTGGVIVALVFSLLMNFAAYWWSDKLALAMAGAKEVSAEQDPELHRIIEDQARLAQIPKPRVCTVQSDSPNAFATGRDPKHAAVAVTSGIRRLLTRDELSGVIAHELGHIGNRDTLIMTVAAAIAGAITWIAFMARWSMMFGGGSGRDNRQSPYAGIIALLVIGIVMPLAAMLVRLAISRTREYQADATGARTSGQPWALADALEKLEKGTARHPMKVNEGVSHLFIVNPLKGGVAGLFSTHPPIQERVRRLRNLYSFHS
ncbi:MAG: zinc metalloprotease HtpX [Chloroflexi bacterium]|nr:zinc metalloprotease HtpX [Chloroflexota bacterium]